MPLNSSPFSIKMYQKKGGKRTRAAVEKETYKWIYFLHTRARTRLALRVFSQFFYSIFLCFMTNPPASFFQICFFTHRNSYVDFFFVAFNLDSVFVLNRSSTRASALLACSSARPTNIFVYRAYIELDRKFIMYCVRSWCKFISICIYVCL